MEKETPTCKWCNRTAETVDYRDNNGVVGKISSCHECAGLESNHLTDKYRGEDKFHIDYDKRTLVIVFEKRVHAFNLIDGDVGDFWHSLVTSDGTEKDVNFYQEEGEEPSVSIYGVEDGLINTNDSISIPKGEVVGDPSNYFNFDRSHMMCDNCGSTNTWRNSSGDLQCDNCGHGEGDE
jgi:hypothetical protein